MSKCKNCRCPFEDEPPSNCRGPTTGSVPITRSDKIPPNIRSPDGVIAGYIRNYPNQYYGLAYNSDGNMLVTGANGSGKSLHIAKTTLVSWQGTLLPLDVKGELFSYYAVLFEKGLVKHKPILLDPNSEYGLKYDPLRHCNTISEYSAIVNALIPEEDNSHNKFWIETERNIV